MRWELRTRLFLRTTEFLWQEGHTAHASAAEAEEEARLILSIYRRLDEQWLAMPPLTGLKSESEKFAGAVHTHALEALMQDNRALQAGTSHFLGQNFSRQFGLTFQSVEGKEEFAYNTSWGVSTRLVGGVVMTHGDDQGLVLPPRLAPQQVVIVPIYKNDDERARVLEKSESVRGMLVDAGVRARVDGREHLSPGAKFYEWERKGVPYRVELGPKDMEKGQLVLVSRVTPADGRRKEFLPEEEAVASLPEKLEQLQRELLQRALRRREECSHRGVTRWEEMKEILESTGGFVYTGWSGDPAVEVRAKEEMQATIRVLPDPEFRSPTPPERCIGGEGASRTEVVWAKAY
jgi:prolyl-tRNA synthetase